MVIKNEETKHNLRVVPSTFGRHILVELWDCNKEKLDDIYYVEKLLIDAAIKAKCDIREKVFHKFEPQGLTGVLVLAESHISIHTFPEIGYASVDAYTCGTNMDPKVIADYIINGLECNRPYERMFIRGNNYGHEGIHEDIKTYGIRFE